MNTLSHLSPTFYERLFLSSYVLSILPTHLPHVVIPQIPQLRTRSYPLSPVFFVCFFTYPVTSRFVLVTNMILTVLLRIFLVSRPALLPPLHCILTLASVPRARSHGLSPPYGGLHSLQHILPLLPSAPSLWSRFCSHIRTHKDIVASSLPCITVYAHSILLLPIASWFTHRVAAARAG